MENLKNELNYYKNKYNSKNQNCLELQKKLNELQTKNKNNLKFEKVVKKRNNSIGSNRAIYESKLLQKPNRYTKISKLLSEKNAHYTELQIENNELKQNIGEIRKELNKLKNTRIKFPEKQISINYNELEYQRNSTQELTILSDNKTGLNDEIGNQSLLKEKIKNLENEITTLKQKNNMSDGFYDMGKKIMDLLQKIDEYKIENEQLKNLLKNDQNDLLNKIKDIEKKYNKEKEKKKIYEEKRKEYEKDIHEKVIQINDLKLEIMSLKKSLPNNDKNTDNIFGKQKLLRSKSLNKEIENQIFKASLFFGHILKNDDYNETKLIQQN